MKCNYLPTVGRQPVYYFIITTAFVFSQLHAICQTNVSGNVSGTWTIGGSPYVLTGSVTILSGNTLTIEPGVEVQFPAYNRNMTVSGTLIANGTVADSIRFVGFPNPGVNPNSTHGGYIRFETTSINSSMDYVIVDRLGDVSNSGEAVAISSSSTTINHSTIKNSEQYGIVVSSGKTPTITNCYFTSNVQGIRLASNATATIGNCSFGTNSRDIHADPSALTNIQNNNTDADIYIANGSIGQNTTWPKVGASSKLKLDGTISVNSGVTLTIIPGVEIEFPNYVANLSVNGTLIANGTAVDSIRFTGFANPGFNPNSSHGGYIRFETTSINSSMDYVIVDRLGDVSNSGEAVMVFSSSAVINHCTIKNSEQYGITVSSGKTPTITNCYFKDNGRGLRLGTNATAPVSNCHFTGHSWGIELGSNAAANIANCTFGVNTRDINAAPSALSNIQNNNTDADIYIITGTIDQNTTWPKVHSSSTFKLDGTVSVSSGITLTINAGVTVEFIQYTANLSINGTLVANGTVTDSIRFVGFPNPGVNPNSTHGGYIRFETTSINSSMDYVIVDRLGDVSNSGEAVAVNSSSTSINHCTIKNSEQYGIVVSSGKMPSITNCYFTSNVQGIRLASNATATIGNCSFGTNTRDIHVDPSALTNIQNNNTDADIYIANGSIGQNTTWPKVGASSKLKLDGTISVNSGVTLTIIPGVEIEFPNYVANLSVNGTLIANGTAVDSIRFTGFANPGFNPNSSHGGYIRFETTSINSSMDYVIVDRLGDVSNSGEAVMVFSSSAIINHSTIKNSEQYGITVSSGKMPTITNCYFTGNVQGIRLASNATATIANCSFGTNSRDVHADPSALTNIQNNNTDADIYITSGTLAQSNSWPRPGTSSKYKLDGQVTLNQSTTLTIASGVLIEFVNYSAQIVINGTLNATGMPGDSIRFVGLPNPAYNPNSSHGGFIRLAATSVNSIMDYVVIDRLGDISTLGIAIDVKTSSFTMDHCSVGNCEDIGIAMGSISASESASPLIQNCQFFNNPKDIQGEPSGLGNIIQNIDADIFSVSTNTKTSVVWHDQTSGSKFHLTGTVTILAGDSITVEPGVSVQSDNWQSHLDVQGTLLAIGTVQDSIKFIGVSNTAFHPSSNYGGYIRFRSTSQNSKLDYVIVDRMGDADTGGKGINAESSGLSIEHSHIRNCDLSGIYIGQVSAGEAAQPDVNNCLFSNNPRDVEALPSGLSNVVLNTNADIYITSTNTQQSGHWRKQTTGSLFHTTGNVTILPGDSITIEPGVSVQSNNWQSNLDVQGTLIAIGTAQDSIKFFGVSNTAFHPSSNYGGYIRFRNTSQNSKLDYVIVDRMGDADTGGKGINAESSGLSIEHSHIRNCDLSGIYIGQISAGEAAQPDVNNCLFSNNPRDIEALPSGLSNVMLNTNADIFITSTNTQQSGHWRKQTTGSLFHTTGNVTILTGDSITIEPGVSIQFDNYQSNLDIQGTLLAIGTAQDSIKCFGMSNTTYHPSSSHGGYLWFRSSSQNSKLDFAIVDRMGDSATGGKGINAESSSLAIEHSLIRNCEQSGIYIGQVSAALAAQPTVTNCLFSNNLRDMEARPSGLSNVLSNINADIFITSNLTQQSGSWREQNAGSIFHATGTVTVSAGDSIVIDPGVSVRFDNYQSNLDVQGTLFAIGTAQDSIWFFGISNTGYHPSSTHGGYIRFRNTSQNSKLDYTIVDRMGDESTGGKALNIETSSLTITNSTFINAELAGISITNAIPVIRYSNITGNPKGIVVTAGQFIIFNCNIYGNAQFGIENTGTDTVDARNNWWGANTGPLHPVLNPDGQGNPVSDRVKFDPWLTGGAANYINDIAVLAILAPESDCGLTVAEPVTVRIYNNGNIIQTGFDVAYAINDGPPVIENVGGLIVQPGNTIDYSFIAAADLSVVANYTIHAFTLLSNDTLPSNDTLTVSVTHFQNLDNPVNLLPANNISLSSNSVQLSWPPVQFATAYDVFIWLESENPPTTPSAANIAAITHTTNLQYGENYKWKVRAKNPNCQSESNVEQFSVRDIPDLTVSSVIAPDTVFAGAGISVDYTVLNQGSGSTLNTNWTERVYISTLQQLGLGQDLVLNTSGNLSALEAGESNVQLNKMGVIPANYLGVYYIIIALDEYNQVVETNNSNNTSIAIPIFVQPVPPADLRVDSVTISPATTFSGQNLSVNWKVKNHGTGQTPVSSWSDRVYLNSDTAFNVSQATLLGSFVRSGILEPDSFYYRNVMVPLPQALEGVRFIHIITDYTNAVFEPLNEDNNRRYSDTLTVIQTPPIDLVVTDIVINGPVSNNQPVTLQWTIKNQGGSPTSGHWFDAYYISPDTSFLNAVLLGTKTNTQVLNPGSTLTNQAQLIIPQNLTAGDYYFFVRTDHSNTQFEYTFENNNITRDDAILLHNPDLIVQSVNVPGGAATSGGLVTVQWEVKNTGAGGVYNQNRTDKIYLSTDAVFDLGSDILLDTRGYSDLLLPNGSVNKQYNVLIPACIAGSYFIFVQTDAAYGILESNEGNNVNSTGITVAASTYPDLIVTVLQVSEFPGQGIGNIQAGDVLEVQYRVTNTGSHAISNQNWNEKIEVSDDASFGIGNVVAFVTNDGNTSLAPGAFYERTVSLNLPFTTAGGNYYVNIKTDSDNTINECTLENNNTASSAIFTVTPYPPLDLSVISANASADSISAGQPVNIIWSVKNIGSYSTVASYWLDAVFLSYDAIFDSSDVLLGTFQRSGTLQPNGTYAQSRIVLLPDSIQGDIFLLVISDYSEVHNDLNRSNNIRFAGIPGNAGNIGAIAVSLPPPCDLYVTVFDAPNNGIAGQPILVNWTVQNTGIGTAYENGWQDRIYLSNDVLLDNGDQLIGSLDHIGSLSPGASYSENLQVFLPLTVSGNKVLIIKTDALNQQYEHFAENNNTAVAPIQITSQPPSDLFVTDVTTAATGIAGKQTLIQWTLHNAGDNPVTGYLRDAIYFSADSIYDPGDLIMGAADAGNIFIPPSTSIQRTYPVILNGLIAGQYFAIVRTDVLNNIVESNDTNNTTVAVLPIQITVKELQISVLEPDTLLSKSGIYYRIEVPAGLAGQTLQIQLFGDSINERQNELYVRYNQVPSRTTYDFQFDNAFQANQEIFIPALSAGTYYLYAYSNSDYTGNQYVGLRADLIPFSILSVDANKGGNIGTVTVKIRGALFTPGMIAKLRQGANELPAKNLYYSDAATVYVTYDLKNQPLGYYDVILEKPGVDTAQLTQGFQIVTGSSGTLSGNSDDNGFTCSVSNIGFDNLFDLAYVHAASTRPGRIERIAIIFGNQGNIDIPVPSRFLVSIGGTPVGFSLAELTQNKKELVLEFREAGGPPNILRPGGTGIISVFTKATTPAIRLIISN